MNTVSDIRNMFKTYIESGKKWPYAIKSILNREMGRRRSTRKYHRRGGATATGAPLTYTMTPGANIGVYGRFPTEIGTDPQSIQDLDVFYASALSRGCGVEDSSLNVPADMGSNKVGGRRRSRRSRQVGASAFSSLMKDVGDTTSTLTDRPYVSTNVPNMLQGAINTWKGNTTAIPTPASPVHHTWKYFGDSSPGIFNPDRVLTSIGNSDSLASSWNMNLPRSGSTADPIVSAPPAASDVAAPSPASLPVIAAPPPPPASDVAAPPPASDVAAPPPEQTGGKSRRRRRASRKRRITHRRRRYYKK